MKKKLILTISVLLCSTNASAKNLIRWLLEQNTETKPEYQGLRKAQLGSTPFYVYKLNNSGTTVQNKYVPMSESEKETARIAIARQQTEINSHADNKPIKRVIDKHRETDETAARAVGVEKRTVYGVDSPLRDDGVIDAWKEAEAAQRRLEEHRTYMEQVRQARKRVEHAKTASGKINQTP